VTKYFVILNRKVTSLINPLKKFFKRWGLDVIFVKTSGLVMYADQKMLEIINNVKLLTHLRGKCRTWRSVSDHSIQLLKE